VKRFNNGKLVELPQGCKQ